MINLFHLKEEINTLRCLEAPSAIWLRSWGFGTDPFGRDPAQFDERDGKTSDCADEEEEEENGDGFWLLHETEVARLKFEEGKLSLAESRRASRWWKEEGFRWSLGVGDEEDRSLSMASQSQLCATRSLCRPLCKNLLGFRGKEKNLERAREREKGMWSNEDKLCTEISLRLGLTENWKLKTEYSNSF